MKLLRINKYLNVENLCTIYKGSCYGQEQFILVEILNYDIYLKIYLRVFRPLIV